MQLVRGTLPFKYCGSMEPSAGRSQSFHEELWLQGQSLPFLVRKCTKVGTFKAMLMLPCLSVYVPMVEWLLC